MLKNKVSKSEEKEEKIRKSIRNTFVFMLLPIVISTLLEFGFPSFLMQIMNMCCYAYCFYNILVLAFAKQLVFPKGYSCILYILYAGVCLYSFARIEWYPFGSKAFFLSVMWPRNIIFIFPLIIMLLPCNKYMDYILHIFYKLSLISIFLWILNIDRLVQPHFFGENVAVYFPFFSAFLLGFIDRFKKKQKIYIIFIFAFYFLLMTLNARRNVMMSMAMFAFFAYISSMGKSKIHALGTIVMGFFCVFMVFLNWDTITESVLERAMNRASLDTRSEVEETFLLDYVDATTEDILFGRGAEGTYYYEDFDEDDEDYTYDRNIVETGYLNIVLKSGVMGVVLILLFMFMSMRRFWIDRKKAGYNLFLFLYMVGNLLNLYVSDFLSIHGVRMTIFWFVITLAIQQKSENTEIKKVADTGKYPTLKSRRRRHSAAFAR